MNRLLAAAQTLAASRGDAEYRDIANGVLVDVANSVGAPSRPASGATLSEEEKAWVMYMEEAMLVDFMEAHFPRSTQLLWTHLSAGGSCPDHLPVTEETMHEDIPRFFQLRRWSLVLRDMLPCWHGSYIGTSTTTMAGGTARLDPGKKWNT